MYPHQSTLHNQIRFESNMDEPPSYVTVINEPELGEY